MDFFKKNMKNSMGQATVEYLLLIVVVIALATGIGGPLGRYLEDFSGALLGKDGYYGCLTEKGLLPGDSRASDCNRKADLALNSLNNISEGSGFSSKSGSGGSDSSSSSDSDSNSSSNSSTDSSSGSDSSSGDKAESFKNSRSSKDRNKNKNAKRHKASSSQASATEGDDSSASSLGSKQGGLSGDSSESPASFSAFPSGFSSKKKKKRKRKKGSDYGRGQRSDAEGDVFNSDNQGYKTRRFRVRRGQGYLGEAYAPEEQKEEQEKPVFKAVQSSRKTGVAGGDSKKNQLIADRKLSGKNEEEPKIKGMSFSGFLKYFVIIALIVVVLIVIFSQVMEYQSRE